MARRVVTQEIADRRGLKASSVVLAHAPKRACIDFHGIPIELAYESFGADAFGPLFAGFSAGAARGNAMQLRLELSREPCAADMGPEWRPTFCHGLMQGYTRDGAHVLSDGQSRIDVFPRLARMSGQLFEGDVLNLSSGMQHVALSLLLRERGIFDTHAATACTKTRAFVLLGDSGAGKTTLLLSLIALGCEFLGDDRLLFRSAQGEIELLAYPREFHVTPQTARLFPELSARFKQEPRIDGKHPLEPLAFWPDQFRRSWRGPISLLLPHVEARATSAVRAVNGAEAFGKLLASSAAVVVDGIERRGEQLEALHALANASNAFDVALGNDLLTEPRETARRILDAIESESRTP
jgi:hypothetical protein